MNEAQLNAVKDQIKDAWNAGWDANNCDGCRDDERESHWKAYWLELLETARLK